MFGKPDFLAGGVPLSEQQKKRFKNIDLRGERYELRDLRKRGGADSRELRPQLFSPLYKTDDGSLSIERRGSQDVEIHPVKSDGTEGAWRWGKGKVAANLDILETSFVTKSMKWNVSYRVYLDPDLAPRKAGEAADDDDDDDHDDHDENTGEPIERSTKPKSFWWGQNFQPIAPESI